MKKFLKIIIGFAIIGVFAYISYIYRSPLQALFTRFEGVYLPCERPITYKIESFDTRFGISKDYFLNALRDAEAIWEKPIGRELFAYEPEGNLKINLIYDYRQEAAAKLQKLGLTVGDDKISYNILKAKYDAFKAVYALDKAALEAKVLDYETRQSAYEKELAYWNARHGAPKDEYDRLNAERVALNAEVAELNQLQAHLNEEIDNINALVVVLNRLAVSLNLDVSKFNTIGKTLGSEFEEGNYQSGPDGQQINIYEFDNRDKLIRILAHELGHALDLGHVDDPNAIMYRLNNGINNELTAIDLADLKKLCGIK
ncbi:MAG: matrixin family metalloprotease [bacterium]